MNSASSVHARSKVKTAYLYRILLLVRPHTFECTCGLLGLGVGSAVNLVFPEVLRRFLDPNESLGIGQRLPGVALTLVVLFLLQGAAFFVRSYFFSRVGAKVVASLRSRVFRSILAQPTHFFDDSRSGDLVSRVNSDAALVQDLVSVRLSVIIRYGVQVLFGVVLMVLMSWKLTVALIVSVGVMVAASTVFVRRLRGASRAYQGVLGALSSFAGECFTGAKVVTALRAEEWVANRFDRLNEEGEGSALRLGLRRGVISALFTSSASALLNLLLLLVLWYGVSLVMSSEISLSTLAAFALYGGIVAVSFSFLIGSYAEVMQALGGVERVFDLLQDDTYGGKRVVTHVPSTGKLKKGIEVSLTDVVFSYSKRQESVVLNGTTLCCPAGTVTALVGPSGSGKSTIVQLILGLYTPTSGTVRLALGNQEIPVPCPEAVAWAPQEAPLFGFSVFENLTMGNESLQGDNVEEVLSQWAFMDFIKDLPQGILTVLGEAGTQLSGGQRQRLAIARALLRQPALLILDEATSGLDSESEGLVLEAIRAHVPHCTVIVVSHRLSTVRAADKVYVVEEGRITQEGTHQSLKEQAGLYRRYTERQSLA